MSFLVPAALGLAALAGPLIALYMLRSKRRLVTISSTMLWDDVGEAVSSAVPWRPLKFSTLLALQLLVLALFVLSLARPFVSEATVLGPHTVFVIDTSGSMAMADRFQQATAAALDLVADVSEANLASVVEAGPAPRVVIALSADAEAVRQAIAGLTVGGGSADLSRAIRLARGLAAPDRDTTVVVLSDGGASPLPEEPVAGATHLVFDDFGPNLALSGFDAEPSTEGVTRVFIQIENHGAADREVTVALEVDGLGVGTVALAVPGLDVARQVTPITAEPGSVVSARIVDAGDALAMDDVAHLVIGGAATRRVAVTGEGSPFLAALLQSAPGAVAVDDPDEADIVVVDGGPLPTIDRPTWLIRPETLPDGLELAGWERNLAVTFQRPGDPVLDGVDLSEVVVAEAQVVEGLRWLPLVSSGPVPLVLLGEVDGHRVAYTTFDLVHSNLPVQVAFPIFGVNLLDWLGGSELSGGTAEPAGTPLALLTPTGARARITVPDGSVRQVAGDAALFVDTHQPGVYRVSYVAEDGTVTPGEVAVRRFVPTESAAPSRQIATTGGPGAATEAGFLIREWAPWVIAVALVLMGIEWWVGHQRPGLRRRHSEVSA